MNESGNKTPKWNSFDTGWMLSLFGTAVGAGILFLPIRAGTGGFWPVVAMCFLVFPMTWLSHRALARFVNSSSNKGSDITKVVEEHFGKGAGLLITILYFFAIYPICLAYGVGITNTFDSFMVNQLGFEQPNRLALAVILISAMMSITFLNVRTINKVFEALVYPLSFVLLAFSLYLIPQWKLEIIQTTPNLKDFLSVLWLTIPVLVFSFNHSPAISTFALNVEEEYGEEKNAKANQILFRTSTMLLIFVMIFVFSCIMSLDAADFEMAREQNIPILSYFANKLNNPIVSYGAPLVAFLAITSSFFGHYFGAKEGLNGIIRKTSKAMGNENPDLSKISAVTTIFMYVTMVVVSYINPSILDFIESLGGPIIATILFLMPMYAIYKVPAMRKFSNPIADYFIIFTGLLAISSILYKLLS